VVRVFEFGKRDEGDAYIIMEYLEGETLAQRLRRLGGRVEPLMALRLGRQMASALAVAHDRGIVHRDLKPDNVMITVDPEAAGGERARLLDFGIAKILVEPLPPPDALPGPNAVTQVGTFMGTPGYMAPEQCRGAEEVDPRADVYSLGVALARPVA
jgi:serine/threonine-protein kinase